MNLDDLRTAQETERRTDSLQPLPDSFYRDIEEYIEGLREERSRAADRADDPFGSEEVRHLTDEIDTAQEVAEAIYDRRLGKLVKRASLAAAGMPSEEEGLTDEEARLFSDLVDQIESHRESVVDAFAGEGSISPDDAEEPGGTADAASTAPETRPGETDGVDQHRDLGPEEADPGVRSDPTPPQAGRGDPHPESAFDASEAMGGGVDEPRDREGGSDDPEAEPEPADVDGPTPDGGQLTTDRTTIRITRDVGEIMGVDEQVYALSAEDVVSLPSANADPLLERDAASRIE